MVIHPASQMRKKTFQAYLCKDLNIREGPFSKEEYEKAKKFLVEGKTSGEDGIPPEVLKRCEDLDEIILDFCNRALMGGEKPDQWSY